MKQSEILNHARHRFASVLKANGYFTKIHREFVFWIEKKDGRYGCFSACFYFHGENPHSIRISSLNFTHPSPPRNFWPFAVHNIQWIEWNVVMDEVRDVAHAFAMATMGYPFKEPLIDWSDEVHIGYRRSRRSMVLK